jgi:ATP-binding cassette subfamily B protein RaxB
MDEMSQLTTPAILHWNLNHFVVLAGFKRGKAVILDPAIGERRLSLAEVSKHFTGVALELTPHVDFKPQQSPPRVKLSALIGKVQGIRRSLLQIFAVALVLQLFAIAGPLANQAVVDDVLTSGDHDLLTVVVLGFGILMVIQTALGFARSWMVMVLGQTLSLQWMGNVFAHLIRLPLRYFEQRHLGDITSRFGSVGVIQQTVTTAVVEAVLDGLMAVAALIMMLLYAPVLASVVITAVCAYGLVRWASFRPFRDAAAEHLVVSAKESTHFLETLRGILPLKLFGREEERRALWQNLIVEVQNRDVRTAKMGIAFSTANAFIFGIENLVVLWLGAKLIMGAQQSGGLHAAAAADAGASAFTLGMLMAFLSYKGQFTGRVSALIDYAVQIKMLGLHSERLADIALEPPERDEVPYNDLQHLEPSLELRHVSFRYGEGEPWILEKASFKVEAGQRGRDGPEWRWQDHLAQDRVGHSGAARRNGALRRRSDAPAGHCQRAQAHRHRDAGRRVVDRQHRGQHQLLRCRDGPHACARLRQAGQRARRHHPHADGLSHADRRPGFGSERRPEAAHPAGPCALQGAPRAGTR